MAFNIAVFIVFIATALAIDWHQHKQPKEISISESVQWVLFYIAVAALFCLFIYQRMGPDAAILFATGYGLEKALAVDNLIVFAAIFSYFRVEHKYQHRILYLGIIGAIVLRLAFVSIGVALSGMLGWFSDLLFGCIILYTAYLMINSNDQEVEYESEWYVKYTKKWLPVTSQRAGEKLFLAGSATPLFICLIAIEASDIMFAFDSVPAIIAVTKDPFLIYASIMFAILGLRSLYFVLSALVRQLIYFEVSVIAVLVLIGAKLIIHAFTAYQIEPQTNLYLVATILSAGIISSLIHSRLLNQE